VRQMPALADGNNFPARHPREISRPDAPPVPHAEQKSTPTLVACDRGVFSQSISS